ncbi:uncharacterized protein LOC110191302 [Drosophila serrata]|uniref:uncharacterized protein LOC110191302 n=1 Tax=Drosophila serrata TaxID=7274 RepID=UPI000A1D095A|nr:uncharacterized protein LOC110191302 [Drosophila serrata]
MSFAANLQEVLQKLLISDEDRAVYTKDAEEIQNFVIEELKKVDGTFREVFNGLSLGGSYLDRVKLNTPDEFDMHMKLKFPLNITPEHDNSAFIYLNAPFIVASCGRIHRLKLQSWLRNAFHKVFQPECSFTSSSRQFYRLSYTLEGYGCAHTIEAVGATRKIKFDLVPAFEFSGAQWPLPVPPVTEKVRQEWPWFAIPQIKPKKSKGNTNFMAIAPHWEREMMKEKDNLKNILRLMKGMRDANAQKMPHLSSYMLKTVLLNQIEKVDWQQDLGTLLVEMWGRLVEHLQTGRLPYYLENEHNILTRMNGAQLKKCRVASMDLLNRLKMVRSSGSYTECSFYLM